MSRPQNGVATLSSLEVPPVLVSAIVLLLQQLSFGLPPLLVVTCILCRDLTWALDLFSLLIFAGIFIYALNSTKCKFGK